MAKREVKITTILQSLIPEFVNENYPLLYEFLKSYYISLSKNGSIQDIVNNIDHYLKLDTLTSVNTTVLTEDLESYSITIPVESTEGFSNNYGLIQIDSEIILYESKTETTFENCIRGFSGISSYDETYNESNIVFESTSSDSHTINSTVKNLDVEFLTVFFKKFKSQYAPGFDEFDENLNQNVFIEHLRDFYSSKGTDESFRILFQALYHSDVEIIKPIDYVFRTSDSQYRITSDLVVESINGDPLDLVNQTIFQNKFDQSIARGTVTNVEQIYRAGKLYYQMSLDYDFDKDIEVRGTVFGKFEITAFTIILDAQDTYLNVDSTLNFPESGSLICDDEIITYQRKTLTQFLDCIGIPSTINDYKVYLNDNYGYGYDKNNDIIRFRITGVLSDLNIPQQTFYSEKGDSIQIKCLGNAADDVRSNHWLFNLSNTYRILSLEKKANYIYGIQLYDDHIFNVGDRGNFIDSAQNEFKFEIIELISNKVLTIRFDDITEIPLNVGEFYLKRDISKFNSKNFLNCNVYSTNVQNCYLNHDSIYISASSLPTYSKSIDIESPQIYFDGSYSNLTVKNEFNSTSEYLNYLNQSQIITTKIDHGFLTGSEISISIEEFSGVYFAYSISSNQLKLARSREALFNVINAQNDVDLAKYSNIAFLKFEKNYTNEFVILSEFLDSNFNIKELSSANLIAKLSDSKSTVTPTETQVGSIGILINGVEIQNYKSSFNIFYGSIQDIYVNDSNSDFDVINPPTITISDSIGTNARANVCVSGELNKIMISEPGFDYIEPPIVKLTGGDGSNSDFTVNLRNILHIERFNSSSVVQNSGDLLQGIVGFSTYHKFRLIEKVVYRTNNQKALVGLSTNAEYYISSVDSSRIKLFKNLDDCKKNINSISIQNYGEGTHYFEAIEKKSTIDSITILNSGSDYKNQKTTIHSNFIDVNLNTFYFKNHNYKTGQIIVYTPETVSIVGLSSNSSYKIETIDEDRFKLKNLNTNLDISLIGVSTNTYHSINYLPIEINISYKTQMAFNNYPAKLIPIFTGKIYKVNLIEGGKNYGSSKIVNHNRQPIFTLTSGSGAQLYPVISNGGISEVIVSSQGNDYESIPDLIFDGPGYGAVLVPIMQNKKIVKVKVINSGIGYNQDQTKIRVKSRGSGARFQASIQKWTINLLEYLLDSKKIPQDGGVLLKKPDILQYTHIYAPKELRQTVFGTKINQNGEIQYQYDIKTDQDLIPTYHSPIIGWAYDGNPIYGPYGYVKNSNNSIVIGQLKSNYSIKVDENRPSTYKLGYFVEDYVYTGINDNSESYLDENNGRYCFTPEFPNGTYAYFATVDTQLSSNSEKLPIFPYLVGNSYHSDYIKQENIDISNQNLIRNTTPYGVLSQNTKTNHFISPNDYIPQKSTIISTKSGKIEDFDIINAGSGYKINDVVQFVAFDDTKTSYKISSLTGKDIQLISGFSTTINNVQVKSSLNSNFYEFYCDEPHSLQTNDIISISEENVFKNQRGSIRVNPNSLTLRNNLESFSSTGIVTYIPVFGNLNIIRPNDVYKIKNEQLKILNIDFTNSRLRVIRNYNSTVGTAYSTNTSLIELSRRFYFDQSLIENQNYNLNDSIYFNPKESLGLGRTFGVGITSTIVFSNPGSGTTSLKIPTRTIYIPNHSIDSYVEANYNLNGYTGISVSNDGINDYSLANNSKVYLNRITDDLVGISTVRVGLNTLGVYVGIQTIGSLLYIVSSGTGEYHQFTTNKSDVLKLGISKNYARVTTKTDHELQNSDSVNIKVQSGITTDYKVEFNSKNKRIIINRLYFNSSAININNNTIEILNHSFKTNDKIIYNSASPSVGLTNDQIYFIQNIDSNHIGLKFDVSTETLIDIQSQSAGSISKINPEINAYRNSTLSFDLSDSSLIYGTYSSFELKFYEDSNFIKEYSRSLTNVQKINSTNRVNLVIDENTPKNLYYKFIPINLNFITNEQKNIITDNQYITNNNMISVNDSIYSGNYSVFNVSSNTFDYNLNRKPELSSYDSTLSQLTYTTNSKNVTGGISNLNLDSVKNSYKTLPGVAEIITESGIDAIIYPKSKSIGKIERVQIDNIGFDYSYDSTLRPTASFPQILKIDPLNSLSKIKILSYGIGYSIYPDLILIDGFTNKIVSDVNLKIDSNNNVKILNNTKGIYNAPPKLIPINNSNGVGISSISYDDTTKNVTVTLNATYQSSNAFPFSVGDNVLIENVQILETDSNYKNYNSSEFDYQTFKITQINPNLNSIVYNYTANFGTYNNAISIGRIIPEKYFPKFEIELSKNVFFAEEIVEDVFKNSGYVIRYDEFNSYLKLLSNNNFKLNTLITGKSSRSVGIIKELNKFESDYNIKATSIVNRGWSIDYITPSNNLQRLHDNDYYQYFSYSIKSNVGISIWNDVVSNLNHPAGFKKFSNLIIESKSDSYSGISTEQLDSVVSPIKFITNRIDLNCSTDFDLVNENYYYTPDIVSNEINFNSQILQDYSESIGNRVLSIDDISGEFDSRQNLNVVNSFRI